MALTLEGRALMAATTLISAPTAAPTSVWSTQETGDAFDFYGDGSDSPSAELAAATAAVAARITPLNSRGIPAPFGGRIGVVAIGQSTTEQWFSTFMSSARARRAALRPGVSFINGGQPGMVSDSWVSDRSAWATLSKRVGGGRLQVQVAFLDAALIFGWQHGGPAEEARVYSGQLQTIIARAKRTYPNLRLVYAFPFHWAGSSPSPKAITEPGGYDMQYGIRRTVLEQRLTEPVVVWGPDVWSQTRNAAFFTDGVHWSRAGRAAMTDLTWRFLADDPAAAQWLWRGNGVSNRPIAKRS
jgi:hypothetical protein